MILNISCLLDSIKKKFSDLNKFFSEVKDRHHLSIIDFYNLIFNLCKKQISSGFKKKQRTYTFILLQY